jgi:hypothetical protein
MAAGFFYIEKAFDTIWHPVWLYKLSKFEFSTNTIKLISFFLSERKFGWRRNVCTKGNRSRWAARHRPVEYVYKWFLPDSKPGMQVHKPWCLLSSNWIYLGNPGDSDFRITFMTDISHNTARSLTVRGDSCAGMRQPLRGRARAQLTRNIDPHIRIWQIAKIMFSAAPWSSFIWDLVWALGPKINENKILTIYLSQRLRAVEAHLTLNGRNITLVNCVKYLGVIVDKRLHGIARRNDRSQGLKNIY